MTETAILPERALLAWAVTTGEAGMRTQARGLAQAVAPIVLEKIASPMTARAWVDARLGLRSLPSDIAAPWPDIVISCGRRSVPLALQIKRASGGKSLAVHIQDPRTQHRHFDLIVAMAHDRLLPDGRTMKVATALHDITPEALEKASTAWRGQFETLGRPLVGVAIGGDLRGRPFTKVDVARLVQGLSHLCKADGAALAIVTSRRTPPFAHALIVEAFKDDPKAYVWDLKGDNPYKGILALADRMVVTSDSVSMVSEAIATGRPVDLFDLEFRRHRRFVESLIRGGFAKRLGGPLHFNPSVSHPDPMTPVVERIRSLIQARIGVSG